MTAQRTLNKRIILRRVRVGGIALLGFVLFGIFFVETPVIIKCAKDSLLICGRIIIPSLFPFMVISSLLLLFGIDRLFDKLFGKIFEKIFKAPREAISAFVLGVICGFPVGTQLSYSLYEEGKITDDELLHLLLFCNVQSTAFIINTVGTTLLGSRRAGAFIYLSQIVALTVLGIAYPRVFKINKMGRATHLSIKSPRTSLAVKLTRSVGGAVTGILSICGFLIFFSVLCGITFDISENLRLASAVPLALSSIAEMTSGCIRVSQSLPHKGAFVVSSMILAFSGLSLHFQIFSLCKEARINYGRFLICKICAAAVAGVCAVAFDFIFKIFP